MAVSFILFFVILLLVLPTWAGPPFITNDPDPPEVGQWDINLPFTLKRSPDGNLSGEWMRVDINYGYDRFTQLSIEVPFPYTREAGGPIHSGVGDFVFEYKRRFGTDDRKGYFGINPQLELPTGDEERGLGAGRVTAQLPLIYQKRWGDALVYGDLRYKVAVGRMERTLVFGHSGGKAGYSRAGDWSRSVWDHTHSPGWPIPMVGSISASNRVSPESVSSFFQVAAHSWVIRT